MTSADPRLSLLPEDIRSYVLSLPTLEEQSKALDRLVQARELTYRTLEEQDVNLIKTRTDENSAFGFLSVDVSFTWEQLSRPGYISIGAFDERDDGVEVPVAFIIAELSRIGEAREWTWEARRDSGMDADSEGSLTPPCSGEEPASDVEGLLVKGGWSASDLVARVYYVGVDFEFRKQGVGRQLLDFVKEVAKAAGASVLCLEVAEWNTNAIEFYLRYGLRRTDQYRKGERGNHVLMVEDLVGRVKGKKVLGARGRRGSMGGSKGGSSSTGKKGFGAARAMLQARGQKDTLIPQPMLGLARSTPVIRGKGAWGALRGQMRVPAGS